MTPGGRRVARYVGGAALLVAGFWAAVRYQDDYAVVWGVASIALLIAAGFLLFHDLGVVLRRREDRRTAARAERVAADPGTDA